MQPNPTEPAYELRVWTYEFAPDEFRAMFPAPPDDRESFIVYQRKIVSNWGLEWVAPNGVWWELWHDEQIRRIDEYTNVYLLVDKIRKPPP